MSHQQSERSNQGMILQIYNYFSEKLNLCVTIHPQITLVGEAQRGKFLVTKCSFKTDLKNCEPILLTLK